MTLEDDLRLEFEKARHSIPKAIEATVTGKSVQVTPKQVIYLFSARLDALEEAVLTIARRIDQNPSTGTKE